MSILKENKQKIIEQYRRNEKDTGSSEVQIAIFTERIANLTKHLQSNKHDYDSRRGLLKLVGKRRKLLDYEKSRDIEKYRKILKDLDLRK